MYKEKKKKEMKMIVFHNKQSLKASEKNEEKS